MDKNLFGAHIYLSSCLNLDNAIQNGVYVYTLALEYKCSLYMYDLTNTGHIKNLKNILLVASLSWKFEWYLLHLGEPVLREEESNSLPDGHFWSVQHLQQ